MLTDEELEHIENQLAEMIEGIDNVLLNQLMNDKDRLDFLNAYVKEFADEHLEGYKVDVKLLSANFNKVFSLKVGKVGQNGAVGYDDECKYCVLVENPATFPDPSARTHLGRNILAGGPDVKALDKNIAPIYASKAATDNPIKDHNLRVSLIPFYENRLANVVNYQNHMPDNAPAEAARHYEHQFGLRAVQNKYFKEHNKTQDFTKQDVMQRKRITSYDSMQTAKKTLLDESRVMRDRGRKLTSFFTSPAPNSVEFQPAFGAHAKRYFEYLVGDIMGVLREEVEHLIDDQARLEGKQYEEIDRTPYDKYLAAQEAQLESMYKKGNQVVSTMAEVEQAMASMNKFLDTAIMQAESKLENLPAIIDRQQAAVLPAVVDILDFCGNLKKVDALYYDLKVDNFLLNPDNKPVITDDKTLAVMDETLKMYNYGVGHMTYAPPENEQSRLNDPDNPGKVNAKAAEALTKFQVGMMMYDMVAGIPGGASQAFKMSEAIDSGITKELDFEHPCFKTPIGQFLKLQIKALTDLDPNARPSLDVVKAECEQFLNSRLQERNVVNLN
ncbi:MAG: hypothetical protein HKM04_10480 [Legionellales bacterium]|nr:hypothetical protein [Legionellales bacterium]